MSENNDNSIGYENYRDQSKRDRTPSWQWLKRAINAAYTQEQWIKMFKDLPNDKQIEYWLKVNPQPREIKGESSVRIVFDMGGYVPKKVEGKVVEPAALPGGDDDDD
jgi:hypothetical protein